MKHSFKKLIAIVLTISLCFAISVPTFAEKIERNIVTKDSGIVTKDSGVIAKEKIALQITRSHINETISHGSNTTWTSKTVISETIETYSPDEIVNGFIFNLQTNGSPSGYIMVYLISENHPIIVQYGYKGTYMVENQVITTQSSKNKKIIFTGKVGVLFEKENDTTYSRISNKNPSVTKNDIMSLYQSAKKNMIHASNRTMTSEQEIYNQVDISDLWNFTPYTMSYFTGYQGHCTPTAGINLLSYWNQCRGVSPLFINDDVFTSFDNLATEMHHTNSGTWTDKAYSGMRSYISKNRLEPIAGGDYKNLRTAFSSTVARWNWLSVNLDHDIPYTLTAELDHYDGRNEDHTFVAVGYQETSTGDYIRVINEWETDRSDFFNFSAWEYDLYNAWYVRW